MFLNQINAQVILFEKSEYDFGIVDSNKDSISHVYNFRNIGDKPLKIDYILVSCGCTATFTENKEYQPGEVGEIILSYYPENRTDSNLYLVANVYTNSINTTRRLQGVHDLILKGKVDLMYNAKLKPDYGFEVREETNQIPASDKIIVNCNENNVYEKIIKRYISDLYVEHIDLVDDEVSRLAGRMRRGGYWSNIDYNCYFRTNWEPIEHVKNLKTMVVGYTDQRSLYFQNDTLFKMICDGLEFWDQKRPISHNWWHNSIGYCQPMTDILAMLSFQNKKISPSLQNSIISKLLANNPRKWTGANQVDIAYYHIPLGCIMENDSIVSAASKIAFASVKITSNEGIQKDLSFHQHGNQFYTGGYGIVFVEKTVETQYCLHETPYQMNNEQWMLFSDFFVNSFLKVFRGSYIDYNTLGRGITRKNNLDKSEKLLPILNKYLTLDSINHDEIRQTISQFENKKNIKAKTTDSNINFWRSDYMLHNRTGYQASVRAASSRVYKVESGNGDNLLGEYLTDGSLYFTQRGDEYYNIFPVWEWNKIPGVTSHADIPVSSMRNNETGETKHVGGVSDGKSGCFAYIQGDLLVKAVKSYFFFNNEIVLLGTGIQSKIGKALHTTINQSHLKGSVILNNNGKLNEVMLTDSVKSNKINWILHDNVGYIFPNGGTLTVKVSNQKGSWSRVDYNSNDDTVNLPVFNLVVNHTKQNDNYAYIIIPDVKHHDRLTNYSNVEIVENNEICQAVYCNSDQQYQINFFKKASIRTKHFVLEVDKPCSLILTRNHNFQWNMVMSDPTQDSGQVNINVKQLDLSGINTL